MLVALTFSLDGRIAQSHEFPMLEALVTPPTMVDVCRVRAVRVYLTQLLMREIDGLIWGPPIGLGHRVLYPCH